MKWVPKYAGSRIFTRFDLFFKNRDLNVIIHVVSIKDRCRLYCRVEQSSAYYLLKDKVIDGTSCGPDTDDICVNGICKQASCNHVLGRKEQLGIDQRKKTCLIPSQTSFIFIHHHDVKSSNDYILWAPSFPYFFQHRLTHFVAQWSSFMLCKSKRDREKHPGCLSNL